MSQSGLSKSFRAHMRGLKLLGGFDDGRNDTEEESERVADGQVDNSTRDNRAVDENNETTRNGDNGRTMYYMTPGYSTVEGKSQIPLFEDETGIKINDLATPPDSTDMKDVYTDILENKGSRFDVGLMDVVWPRKFAVEGWTEPVEDRQGHSEEMIDTQVDMVTVDGQLQAMPIFTDANALYYRKDKLTEYGYSSPPETESELVEIALDITQRDDEIEHGFIWQGGLTEGLTVMWFNWVWGRGGSVYSGDDLVVDSEKGVDALQRAVDLIHRFEISPEIVATGNTLRTRQTFEQGETLFMRHWPTAVSRMNDGTAVAGKFDVTTLPTHEDHPDSNNACLGGWNLFVNPHSNNKPEAQEFLNWMATEDVQKRHAIDHTRLPVRESLYDDEDVRSEFEKIDVFKHALDRANSRPSLQKYPLFSEIIYTECNAALRKEKSPEEALRTAQRKIDEQIN